MYDQPLLAMYELALQQDGSTTRVNVTVQPTTAGAPAFPGTLENTPPGFVRPTQSIAWRSIPTSGSPAAGRTTCSSSAG